MPAYAMLDCRMGKTSNQYTIRLNAMAGSALADVEFVQVLKSQDYIVLKPADMNSSVRISRVLRHKSSTRITCNGYVDRGFFHKAWFGTGEKYKVKKDANGCVYICRKEVLDIGK